MYGVVDGAVSRDSAEAERAGQSVAASGIYSCSTGTHVWLTYCDSKAQADRHPNVLVFQSQPIGSYRYDIEERHRKRKTDNIIPAIVKNAIRVDLLMYSTSAAIVSTLPPRVRSSRYPNNRGEPN